MKADLCIHGGWIVTEHAMFRGGVAVHNGRISELLHGEGRAEAAESIDLGGRILLPGAIDSHAHFSEPGRDFEGYRTGSMAAAAGGVTTALDMPLNDLPPTVDRQKLLAKREMVRDHSVIDYAHWGGLITDNLKDLAGLHEEGVIGFKAFMRTVADFPRIDDDLMYAGLLELKQLGNVLGVHAENEYITRYLREQFQAAGRFDRAAWAESRPPWQELEAIQRAIFWARVTGGRLHVLHVSIADAVRVVAQARLDGVNVSCETCSHYLFFDEQAHLRLGPYAKAAPPLRPRADVEALWACVLEGLVATIASDHSPFPPARYENGLDNVWEGGGITGIQTMLPAVITAGVHGHGLSWPQVARLLSANPARIFGLYPIKGAMLPGSDADLVIIDPDQEWTLQSEDLLYRYKQSPYVGETFKGRIDRTIVRGKTVYRDGEITVEPGYGKLLLRSDGVPYRIP
jgi:allantoinase